MTVPAYWRDNSGDMEGYLAFNKTIFDKFGLEVPTSDSTLDEIIDVLTKLQKAWEEEDGVTRYVYEHSNNRCPIALHRIYDRWPYFTTQDGVFAMYQDGTAELFFATEDFKKDCEFMQKLYEAGLTHPDCLNQPNDEIVNNKSNGDFLMGIQTAGDDIFDSETQELLYDMQGVWLNESAPFLTTEPLLNSNAIPVTTSHPEAGLMFLNWMYASEENQNLVLYGIEGVTWERVGEDEMRYLTDEYGTNYYDFDAWMIEYIPYHLWYGSTMDEFRRADYVGNVRPDQMEISVACGFKFDTTPVATEYTNMMSEYSLSILPIKKGVLPYEGNFEAAMERMRAAGCEKVIAEYQRQLTAFIESQK